MCKYIISCVHCSINQDHLSSKNLSFWISICSQRDDIKLIKGTDTNWTESGITINTLTAICIIERWTHVKKTYLFGFCQATNFTDFYVNDVSSTICMSSQQCVNTINVLIQNEWQVCMLSDLQTFFISFTWLFNIYVQVFNSICKLQGLMWKPTWKEKKKNCWPWRNRGTQTGNSSWCWQLTSVCISNKNITAVQSTSAQHYPLNIFLYLTSKFQLEFSVAFCMILLNIFSHFLRW